MPRIALAGFVLALVLPLTVQAAPTRTATPTLRLLSRTPVVVKGSRFDPGELVRIVARAGSSETARTVTANAAGTFRVPFSHIRLPGCREHLVVRAYGETGNYAWLRCRRGRTG